MRARGSGRPPGCGGRRRRCSSVGDVTVHDRLRIGAVPGGRSRPRPRHRRPKDPRTSHRRGGARRLAAALRRSDRVPPRNPLRRAGHRPRLPGRARPHGPPRKRPPAGVGVRGHRGRRGAGRDPARRPFRDDRGRRHGRRPFRAGSGGQGAGSIQRPHAGGRRARSGRARHLRRVARGRLGLEPRRDRRLRRRRETARRQGGHPGRSIHRRRRGTRDRLRRRPRRPDRQPQSGRPDHVPCRAHGRPVRREPRGAPRRRCRERRAERQPGRVPRGPAPAGRPRRRSRDRPRRRRLDDGRRPCAVLELRLVCLAGRAGSRRARRSALDRPRRRVQDRPRPRLAARPLRHRKRHLLRRAAGGRRGRARLGREPFPHRGGRRDDPGGDRLRRRGLGLRARLRGAQRRGGRRAGVGQAARRSGRRPRRPRGPPHLARARRLDLPAVRPRRRRPKPRARHRDQRDRGLPSARRQPRLQLHGDRPRPGRRARGHLCPRRDHDRPLERRGRSRLVARRNRCDPHAHVDGLAQSGAPECAARRSPARARVVERPPLARARPGAHGPGRAGAVDAHGSGVGASACGSSSAARTTSPPRARR